MSICLGNLSQKCFESNTKCGKCDKKRRCSIAAPFEPGGRFGMAAACALAMFSGKSIFICSSETPAGVSELLFHGRGRSVERYLLQKSAIRVMQKGAAAQCSSPLEGQVTAAQTSKLGSSFSMWMLDIKALCSGSVNSASFTYLFSTAAVRMGSAMVPAPPMQPPGQPMPSSR